VGTSPLVPEKTMRVDLDKFLATPMLKSDGHIFSVREVIKGCANMMGGIHVGVGRDEKEKAFLILDKASESDKQITLAALRAACT